MYTPAIDHLSSQGNRKVWETGVAPVSIYIQMHKCTCTISLVYVEATPRLNAHPWLQLSLRIVIVHVSQYYAMQLYTLYTILLLAAQTFVP